MKNIIETHRDGPMVEVTLYSAFNLRVKHLLEDRLNEEITNLRLDLSHCRLIDSEGVVFLYKWQQLGKKLEIMDPPPVLFEILDVLELSRNWDMETIINS